MIVGRPTNQEGIDVQVRDDVGMLDEAQQARQICCQARLLMSVVATLFAGMFFTAGFIVGSRLASTKPGQPCGTDGGGISCEDVSKVTRCVWPRPPCKRSSSPKHADGLIFIGLSLSRHSLSMAASSSNWSVSRQTQFDFNMLQDRDYHHVCRTNDDGWLVGGGESDETSGPSWKLANADSAHVEIVRIGNGNAEYGGLDEESIIDKMRDVRFGPIKVFPSSLVLNGDHPPEVELRFDAVENPDLAHLQEKLARVFTNPSLTFPDHFHMTVARKVDFYSKEHEDAFLQNGAAVIHEMRQQFPKGAVLQPDSKDIHRSLIGQDEIDKPGGVYLFWSRNQIVRYFPPTVE